MQPSQPHTPENANLRKARTLGNTAEAAALWVEIVAQDPSHLEALAAVQALAEQGQRDALVSVLQTAVGVTDSAETKLSLQLVLANLWEKEPADLAQARVLYEEVLKEQPTHTEAFVALLQVLELLGDEDAILGLCLDYSEQQPRTAAAEVLVMVGQRLLASGENENAYEVLVDALLRNPAEEGTARLLAEATTRTNQWSALFQHEEIVKALEATSQEAAALLANNVARWYEQLGNLEYAIAWCDFVLSKHDAKHPETLSRIEALYEKTSQHRKRAETLWTLLSITEALEEKKAIVRTLASLYQNELQAKGDTIRAYLALLELDPNDETALAALEPLYESEEAFEQLLDLLTRRAQRITDKKEAAALRMRIGKISLEKLNDDVLAASSYRDALDLNPQDEEARTALETLLEKQGRTAELLDLLDLMLEHSQEQEQLSLLRRRAVLLEKKLSRLEEAAQTYEKILQRAPNDEESFQALSSLLARSERWGEYTRILRRRISGTISQEAAVELLHVLGEIVEQHLDDETQAIEVYEELLSRKADDLEALRTLSKLYAKSQEWERAISVLRRMLERVPSREERVAIYQRMGDIAQRELGDSDQAQRLYQFAVDVDPSFVPAIRSLRLLFEEKESYEEAARLLKQEEQQTKESTEKAKILAHLGEVFAKKLGDEKRAAEAWKQALQAHATELEAARPLADLYFSQERYAEAEPLYDMIVGQLKLGREEARAQGVQLLLHRLGLCAERLGNMEKALAQLRAAYELDDKNLQIVYDLAEALYKQGEHERAFSLYQALLSNPSTADDEQRLVEIQYRQGAIRLAQGDTGKAISFFENALRLNPRHRQSLESMLQIRKQEERFEEAAALQRTRIEIARDMGERFGRLVELAELLRDKLKNTPKAIATYQEALALRPEERGVLFQLMNLYHQSQQWQKAIDVIQRMATLETDTKRRARFQFTAAVISRDELKKPEDARMFFEKALDDDPMYEAAFDSIKSILVERGEYQELERAYRRELIRLPKEGELAWLFAKLSHDLGMIYKDKLNQALHAAEAFEIAARIEPNNLERHEMLAELYQQIPGKEASAITHHRTLLALDANRVSSYQALFGLYVKEQQYDRAYCLASALSFMRRAGQDEQRVLDYYRPASLTRVSRRIDEEVWRTMIAHPEENIYLSGVFRLSGLAISQLYAQPEKQLNVKRKDRTELVGNNLPFAQCFLYVQQALSVVLPDLHLRPNELGFQLVNSMLDKSLCPIFVVGPDISSLKNERELVFQIARNLVYLRPEYYLARAVNLQAPTLQAALLASLRVANPAIPVAKGDEGVVMRLVDRIRPLLGVSQTSQLLQLSQKILEEKPDLSISTWLERLELGALRLAFALCGDLEIAARSIQAEASPVGTLSAKDKLKDLVLYSVSEEYFTLRETLGVEIRR